MRKQKKALERVALVILSVSVVIAIVFAALAIFIYKGINFEADEKLFDNSGRFESTTFYADVKDGEPQAIETSGFFRKIHYSLEEMSPYVKEGFIAVEDKIFYEHRGVDLKRTIMAAGNYLTKKEKSFGASTITQQVIKNISGDNQVSLKRKLAEIIRAIHIERRYSKEEILEVYLNVIPMSDNIYGIGAASKAYFGKEPSDLTVAEAATLIGITNAPTAYSPYIHPNACTRKRNIILKVMLNDGIISQEEYELSINAPLTVISRDEREDQFDSWFVEKVIDDVTVDLAEKYGINIAAARIMLLGGGYKVYTTMNPSVQYTLENYFENISNLPNEAKDGLNYAMVVTDSKNGDLVGIIGRAGEKKGNRLLSHALIPHIPASSLKPIALYAPLIDEGVINWATVFDDVPVSFIDSYGTFREYPKNSPDIYDGLTSVKDAIRLSKNTVAVRLCNIRSPKTVFRSLRDNFGISTLVEKEDSLTDIAVAPMALGQLARGVSLMKLTECYSVFPGDGMLKAARSYYRLVDHKGSIVLTKEKQEKRVFKNTTARIMNRLLMNVTENGTAKAITLNKLIHTAGKTGTSSGNRDKIFLGYTPYYIAGIWCGYDNGREIGPFSKSHLEIWDEIMTRIHQDILEREEIEDFSTEGLIYLPYCKDSGELFSENCIYDPRGSRREYGYFTEDNRPKDKCERHIICLYDSETKAVACENCPKDNLVAVSLISIKDRAFPKEIYVTDAEYVYRDVDRYEKRPIDYALPYFEYIIPDGVYVGKSKSKKQFNSNCYIHDE